MKNLLKVSNEVKEHVKIQLLDLINDFEQVFPMETAIKYLWWRTPYRANYWHSCKLMFFHYSNKYNTYLLFHKDMPEGLKNIQSQQKHQEHIKIKCKDLPKVNQNTKTSRKA